MLGTFHTEARHLALDDAWIRTRAPLGKQLEEQLQGRLVVRVVKGLRGKNPGGTPRSDAPPGGLG
jgi:hypothetical protein